MTANSDHSLLFEPVRIGPVTAKNRFYQAPHGCGFGYRDPSAMVEIRRTKAEGGWGVICTEQTEIHPTSDMTPYAELRNWDDRDLPVLAAMVDGVHEHGALAALELSHSGVNTSNLGSRATALGPSAMSTLQAVPAIPEPFQAREMDRADIAALRRWHKDAALRGVRAGFDIIYVYAGQFLSLPNQFLSTRFNRRTDDYGGALENRLRLLRELIEDTLEAAGGRRAVAVRLTIDELVEGTSSGRSDLEAAFDLIGDLPDLWDITISGWSAAMAGTTRFDFDMANVRVLAAVKDLTEKPVVSVRFFPTVDDMVELVAEGLVDLIGCARQSIADPFLPRKIEAGQSDRIRTCIKCNICVADDLSGAGVRCTQNPTFGDEWRRGWHPERIPPKRSEARVLVVGAGPAGLECAAALGERGYAVKLCEAAPQAGGRVLLESRLPLLERWLEVAKDRLARIARHDQVELCTAKRVTAEDALASGCDHVVIATGATWRRDGLDRRGGAPRLSEPASGIFTPDDILAGRLPEGRVAIYDDDHYCMGGLLAERLTAEGRQVVLVTPAAEVSSWTHRTMEQALIQKRLLELGVEVVAHRYANGFRARSLVVECVFTGSSETLACDALVLVTCRQPNDRLLHELRGRDADLDAAGIRSVTTIGDAHVPGLIAQAVRSGHRWARELDLPVEERDRFERDVVLP